MPTTPTRVLVVEDDDTIRHTMRLALEDEGYTVAEARDGEPVLDWLCGSAAPALVLLDLQMPGMDGRAVLEAAAKDAGLMARHGFILVTAYSGRTLPLPLLNILSAYGIPIVAKPFNLDHLLDVTKRAEMQLLARAPMPVARVPER
jgi:CheY-like chemotaxis protein